VTAQLTHTIAESKQNKQSSERNNYFNILLYISEPLTTENMEPACSSPILTSFGHVRARQGQEICPTAVDLWKNNSGQDKVLPHPNG